jgi:hypothetical protein
MLFKKYSEFVENKKQSQPSVVLCLDAYREHLMSNLSGLVLKNSPIYQDALKKTIDVTKIKKSLLEIGYPYIESFSICLENGQTDNIARQIQKFDNWLYLNSKDTEILKFVESAFWKYQLNLMLKKIDPKDVDLTIFSLVDKSRNVLGEMAFKIEKIIESIAWDNHPIFIEALIPTDDWIVDSARISIGEYFQAHFDMNKKNENLDVTTVIFTEMPQKMRDQIDNLLNRLKESPKIKQIMTLYMSKPENLRDFFERKKRDVALGIKAFIPQGTLLQNKPFYEGQDLWKVKIDYSSLVKTTQEGDVTGYQLLEDANVRWIELIKGATP